MFAEPVSGFPESRACPANAIGLDKAGKVISRPHILQILDKGRNRRGPGFKEKVRIATDKTSNQRQGVLFGNPSSFFAEYERDIRVRLVSDDRYNLILVSIPPTSYAQVCEIRHKSNELSRP